MARLDSVVRCGWATTPASIAYHDEEWGRPLHDERRLFELLVLEGAQAGLSWETILNKRAHYREAFDDFEIERVAAYGARKVAALMRDPGIVRNRAKIVSAIGNARAALALRDQGSSLDTLLWAFVDDRPIVNRPRRPAEIPASTPLAATVSADLRRRGFSFVGPTIVYALMQATGMVDDHLRSCFRCRPLPRRRKRTAGELRA
ncbi:MAG: DNA-3-methyladenine glycosylase I [Vulcanimicrobiaceae bacterium]